MIRVIRCFLIRIWELVRWLFKYKDWRGERLWLCWVLTECAGAGLDSSAQLSRQQMETHTDYQTAPSLQSAVSPVLSCWNTKIIIFVSSTNFVSLRAYRGRQQIKQPILFLYCWSIIWNMTLPWLFPIREICSAAVSLQTWPGLTLTGATHHQHLLLPELLGFHLRNIPLHCLLGFTGREVIWVSILLNMSDVSSCIIDVEVLAR